MRIAIVDGQGGGIGKIITEKLRKELKEQVEILVFGTNALATSAMLRAGANDGATGENAIVRNMSEVDIIIGPIAVIVANSMQGELTPKMAEAIATSKARKMLLPLNRCGIEIVGCESAPLPHLVDELMIHIKRAWREKYV